MDYFTSSKRVKTLIDLYGKDDFKIKILKTFKSSLDTLKYENKLNRLVIKREDYLNLYYNFIIDDMTEEDYDSYTEKMRKVASLQGKLSFFAKIGIHGLSKEEKRKICSNAGIKTHISQKENDTGMYGPEVVKRAHKTLKKKQVSAYYDPVLKVEICKKGGENGCFSKIYYEKNGLSEEARIETQRECGRRGGLGNKGFIWYNDDIKSYKYTPNQQKIKSFEDFMNEHSQYAKGFITDKKDRIWANDGTRNYFILSKEFEKTNYVRGKLQK